MRLYHFTTTVGCKKILSRRRLKGSLFNDLNDPFELLAISTGEKMSRILLKHMKAELNRKYCLLCFSDSWQETLLWAHYADKHQGVCLGFDVRDGLAQKVDYVQDRLEHSFSHERVPFSPRAQELTRQSLHTKHSGWSYEREWRVFTAQDVKDADGNFYAPFGDDLVLREVILGERCPLAFRDVANLLDPAAPATTIRAARTAFTTFGVVKNQARTPKRVGKS
jgi:hypothetical protein